MLTYQHQYRLRSDHIIYLFPYLRERCGKHHMSERNRRQCPCVERKSVTCSSSTNLLSHEERIRTRMHLGVLRSSSLLCMNHPQNCSRKSTIQYSTEQYSTNLYSVQGREQIHGTYCLPVKCAMYEFAHSTVVPFLLRDAMIACYMLWLCVRLSVCPSQAAIVSKWPNVLSCIQCSTMAQGL